MMVDSHPRQVEEHLPESSLVAEKVKNRKGESAQQSKGKTVKWNKKLTTENLFVMDDEEGENAMVQKGEIASLYDQSMSSEHVGLERK